MKKNVGSQVIGIQMINASDGTAFTGTASVSVTGDGGAQGPGGGTGPDHEGNGFHSYVPTAGETNYDHIAFTFTGTGAIPATIQVYTGFPQSVDNETRLAIIETDTNSLNDIKIPQTLNLTAAGNIGVDWANVENQATAVDLAATDIQLADTTTDVTNQVTANATAINGSTAAAANLANWLANLDTQIDVASATASTIVFDDAALIGTDNYYVGMTVFVYGGTGAGQSRMITAYTGASKTATVVPDWGTNPDATSDVLIMATGNALPAATQNSIDNIEGDTNELQQDWANTGRLDTILDSILDDTGTSGVVVATNNDKTGYSISGTKTTLDALNDVSTAEVNTEVDNALNTAIPGSPTADSINERIAAIDDKLPTGTISDFDETTDPVELLDTGGAAGTSAEELVDDVWDELLTAGEHNVANSSGKRIRDLQESGSAYGGYVWIDILNGTAGTESYVNGTSDNPVNNIANANTIASNIGATRFRVAPGSSITFAAAHTGQTFEGKGWTLDLGSQDINNSCFIGATVSGTGINTTGKQLFVDCAFDTATTLPGDTTLVGCAIGATITLGEADDYYFEDCYSAVAGSGTPTLDWGAGLNASNVSFRHYSGGIEIQNMGAGTGSYAMSLEGNGQLVINANCSATSSVSIRGHFTVTDNAGGAVTLTDDARYDVGQINAQVVDGLNTDTYGEPGQGAPPLTTTLEAKIAYLYKAWRNQSTQSATTFSLYNDGATVVDQKATTSEAAGTVTKGEVVTGP